MFEMPSRPCDEQRKLMEELGFESISIYTNNQTVSNWRMTWYDDKEEKIIRTITVQFDSYSVPTLPEVLLALRDKAFQEGQAAKISEIKGALHISDRTPSMFDRIG